MAARKKTGAGGAAKAKKQTQAAKERQHAEVMEKARQLQAQELVAAAPHSKATATASASSSVKVTKGRRGKKPHRFQRRDRDDSQQVSATMPIALVDTLRSICEQRKESVTRPFVQRDVIELALTEWCHRALKQIGDDELENALTVDELAERIAALKR